MTDPNRTKDGKFKEGCCPNPKGRPKRTETWRHEIRRFGNEPIPPAELAKLRKLFPCIGKTPLTWKEAIVVKLYQMGFKGDNRAIKLLMDREDGMPKASLDINTINPLVELTNMRSARDEEAKIDEEAKAKSKK